MFGIKTSMNLDDVKPITTGFMLFDILIGGLPKGRITHLFSPDGVGKTTLSLYLISNAMYIDKKEGRDPYFFYLDCEQAYSSSWLKTLFFPYEIEIKVDDDKEVAFIIDAETGKEIGIIIQPIYYEDIEIILEKAIKFVVDNKKSGYILWDSVVKPITRKFEKSKETLAFRPTAIQNIIDKFLKPMADAEITAIFINQIRDKIATQLFVQDVTGETEDIDKKIPGGWALKFAASLSLTLLKKKSFRVGGDIEEVKNPYLLTGKVIQIKSGKNRLRSGGVSGNILFVDDFGPSQILSSIALLINDQKKVLGNVPGKYFNKTSDIRFDRFIFNLDSYLDQLVLESAKKAIVKFGFRGKDKLEWLKSNFSHYKEFYEKEAYILPEKAKEFGGVIKDDLFGTIDYEQDEQSSVEKEKVDIEEISPEDI